MSPCGVGSPVHLDNQPASTVATLASVKPTVSRTFSLQIRIKLNNGTIRFCLEMWLGGMITDPNSGPTLPYQVICSHPSSSPTFQCSQDSYTPPCAYIHYLGYNIDDNLPSISILKDVNQCIDHGKQEYLKKLDRSCCRSSMKHCGMLWNIIEHPGTLWNMIEYSRILWNLVEFSKNIMEIFGKIWNLAGTALFSI